MEYQEIYRSHGSQSHPRLGPRIAAAACKLRWMRDLELSAGRSTSTPASRSWQWPPPRPVVPSQRVIRCTALNPPVADAQICMREFQHLFYCPLRNLFEQAIGDPVRRARQLEDCRETHNWCQIGGILARDDPPGQNTLLRKGVDGLSENNISVGGSPIRHCSFCAKPSSCSVHRGRQGWRSLVAGRAVCHVRLRGRRPVRRVEYLREVESPQPLEAAVHDAHPTNVLHTSVSRHLATRGRLPI